MLADKAGTSTPPPDIFSYWVLSDVFDEAGGPSGSYMLGHLGQPFGQVFGVMTVQGIRKATFNAFKLLNMTGPKRLIVSGGNDNSGGINGMATTSDSGDSLQILLYNYNNTLNTASGSGDSQAISVTGLPSALAGKEVSVTTYVVDENNSNPYSVWKSKTSSCTSCTEDQWRQIKAAQHLAVTTTKKTVDTTFSTTVTMLKQSATLIILSTKRPLMGRDAFTEIEAEDYDGQSNGKAQDSGDATTLGQSVAVAANGYLYFEKVDYSDDGASSVDFRYKAASDATVELRQDSDTGTSLGKCTLAAASSWTTQNCKLSQAVTGVSKLYLMFGGAAEVNYLKFQGSGSTPGSGGASGAGGSAAGGSSGSSNGGASGSAAGGSSGRGGAAGNAAGGAAGGGNGGAAGSGNGGTTSSSNGNGGSSGGSGNSGGSAGSGNNGNGGSGSGGASGAGGSTNTGGSSGCACRIGDTRGPSSALVIVGFIAAALGLRRSQARRRAPRD